MEEMSKRFTDGELSQINSQHYFPILFRGEGHTREVFKALLRKNGSDNEPVLEKEVAFKITKKKVDETSVCTLINLSKMKNPNTYEMEYFRHFDAHPNITSILDAFEVVSDDGKIRYVTVEEWNDGQTLEEYVTNVGILNKYDALKFSAATLKANAYMHYRNRDDPWIMRDIKPSNVMNDNELPIRYTDLQNGKYRSQIRSQLFPTRGGTPYTHPMILDSFMKGKESMCDIYTDIYAWGGTLYFGRTGKNPFNYTMEHFEGGIPVYLGYKMIYASVMLDGKPVKSIDRDEHNENVLRISKDVPEEFRPIIFDTMYWGDKPYTVKEIVKAMREIDHGSDFKESWNSISSFIKTGRF